MRCSIILTGILSSKTEQILLKLEDFFHHFKLGALAIDSLELEVINSVYFFGGLIDILGFSNFVVGHDCELTIFGFDDSEMFFIVLLDSVG